jgi:hypothetical protein
MKGVTMRNISFLGLLVSLIVSGSAFGFGWKDLDINNRNSQMRKNLKDLDETRRQYTSFRNSFSVLVKNKCGMTILVAVRYVDDSCESGCSTVGGGGFTGSQWATEGWYQLAPGQSGKLVNTKNAIIFFSAYSSSGAHWGNNNHMWEVRGMMSPFFQVNMGNVFTEYEQGFTCN